MDYKEHHRRHWNALAQEFGLVNPLRAVISTNSDHVNYYYDIATKRFLKRAVRFRGKKVLDLGCGVGRLSVWLAASAAHVTGLDISEEMIRIARSTIRSRGLINASFGVYDGIVLPFEDNVFNVTVCAGVLKYVVEAEDFAVVIAEICRTVRPGGRIVIIDEFDYFGPTELRGCQDIGEFSVVRKPGDYISIFERNGALLREQWAMHRKRVQARGSAAMGRLPFGKHVVRTRTFTRLLARADVFLDELLRCHEKPVRGFQMLVFERV